MSGKASCKEVQDKIDTNANKYCNTVNAELNPICQLLVLLRAQHILHVRRVRFNVLLMFKWLGKSVRINKPGTVRKT